MSSTRPTALFEICEEGGWTGALSLNVTIIDRYVCETCMGPVLQPVIVGSLLESGCGMSQWC